MQSNICIHPSRPDVEIWLMPLAICELLGRFWRHHWGHSGSRPPTFWFPLPLALAFPAFHHESDLVDPSERNTDKTNIFQEQLPGPSPPHSRAESLFKSLYRTVERFGQLKHVWRRCKYKQLTSERFTNSDGSTRNATFLASFHSVNWPFGVRRRFYFTTQLYSRCHVASFITLTFSSRFQSNFNSHKYTYRRTKTMKTNFLRFDHVLLAH